MILLKKLKPIFSMGIFLTSCGAIAQPTAVVKTPHRTIVTTRTPNKVVVHTTPAPRRAIVVASLPKNAIVITHGSVSYHYHAGVYYTYNRGQYVVTTPPIGIRIHVLPKGYTEVIVGGTTFYHYEGSYYIKTSDGQYETVKNPQNEDKVVFTLPEDAEKIVVDGDVVYVSGGTLYKVVVTPEGKGFKEITVTQKL